MKMDFGLSGQHVLITGSAGGIGVHLAQLFLEVKHLLLTICNLKQQGCKVSCHYHRSSTTLSKLVESYTDKYNSLSRFNSRFIIRIFLIKADATSEEEVVTAVQTAVKKFGTMFYYSFLNIINSQ
jgi:NAD(P)-dependent dehydrogenase (short-subunit alcohol dehydrogenase family)